MSNIKKLTPIFLLLTLGFIWGSGYAIARYATTTTDAVTWDDYSFWQSIGPAVLLLVVLWIQKIKLPLSPKYLFYYLVCGVVGIAIPNTIMYFVVGKLPSGLVALMVNTVPIFIYAMAVRHEGFSVIRLIGVLLGIAGLSFILLPEAAFPNLESQYRWYPVLLLLTPFCFALCAVFISKYWPHEAHPLTLSTGMLIVSAMVLMPMAWKVDHSIQPLWVDITPAKCAVMLEVILSSIGYVLLFRLLKLTGPIYYSLVGGVVVLTGLFWGRVVFGEHLNVWSGIAVVLILLAIVIMSVARKGRDI